MVERTHAARISDFYISPNAEILSPVTEAIEVLSVDSRRVVRHGLHTFLEVQDAMEVVGETVQ